MNKENYRYKFANVPFDQHGSAVTNVGSMVEAERQESAKAVPWQEIEDTFMLALLAVESLHGHSLVRMEARFSLDKDARTCVIDACTKVGSDLASIFTGFATKEYGERAVFIEREGSAHCACVPKSQSAGMEATL